MATQPNLEANIKVCVTGFWLTKSLLKLYRKFLFGFQFHKVRPLFLHNQACHSYHYLHYNIKTQQYNYIGYGISQHLKILTTNIIVLKVGNRKSDPLQCKHVNFTNRSIYWNKTFKELLQHICFLNMAQWHRD